jgi:hypothetical protein
MEIIFFDYYHPYAGLCNQLYLLTNHIHNAYSLGKRIYIHKFNIDIFKKTRIPFRDIFDIKKTNENLKQLTGIEELISTKQPEIINFIPKLCIYPVSNVNILNCLEFNETKIKMVKTVQDKLGKNYYAIHFRLEADCILHYTYPPEVYNKFMDLSNVNEQLAIDFFDSLDKKVINEYCIFLMKQYISFIYTFGFSKTWYISTNVTKNSIHDYFKVYLNDLINFIIKNGGNYFISELIYKERELNALVDLLILRDSSKMIGFQGSSFSEGYCYKVNEIRKVTTDFLFVKEK